MSRTLGDQKPPTHGLSLRKYGRFWAVYDQGMLVVVTVYKKGALAVIQRLARPQSTPTAEEIRDGRSHP